MSTEMAQTNAERSEADGEERRESTRGVPVFRPLADIRDTAEGVVLTLEMPGVGPDDVDIDVERGVLTIRGRGRVTAPEGYRRLHVEYGEGDYERSFTLSQEIDHAAIRAEMANGVLTLTLPRAEAAKPRRVEVKAAG